MKKIINYKNYRIIVNDSEKYTDKEINCYIKNALKHIKDVAPMYAPEEDIQITYEPKSGTGGKSALSKGMVTTAFKERHSDNGATFELYLKKIIENLDKDIADAEYIVSGENENTRNVLLEEYVIIERYAQKYAEERKTETAINYYNTIKSKVNELSSKLGLNYWRQPKFPQTKQVNAATILRAKHKNDSQIKHVYKPVFLCSPGELKATAIDAKNGKFPELFEINLKKVQKDINADYNRIKAKRDNYPTDINIKHTLPEIVEFYELAIKLAKDLGYNNYADDFETKLKVIKEAWSSAL